jgi:hypothetical protein
MCARACPWAAPGTATAYPVRRRAVYGCCSRGARPGRNGLLAATGTPAGSNNDIENDDRRRRVSLRVARNLGNGNSGASRRTGTASKRSAPAARRCRPGCRVRECSRRSVSCWSIPTDPTEELLAANPGRLPSTSRIASANCRWRFRRAARCRPVSAPPVTGDKLLLGVSAEVSFRVPTPAKIQARRSARASNGVGRNLVLVHPKCTIPSNLERKRAIRMC